MADWLIAMLCLVPLLLTSSYSGAGFSIWWRGTEPKARVWCAVMLASLSTVALDPVQGAMPFASYICIDALAGMAVMARPSGLYSRSIGALFLAMVAIDTGAAVTNHNGAGAYQSAMVGLGWAMWAILLAWGGRNAAQSLISRFGSHGNAPAARDTAATFGRG